MPRFKKHNVRLRFLLTVSLAAIVAAILPSWMSLAGRILCIWDAAMVFFLVVTWLVMAQATPNSMRRYAQQQDAGRTVIYIVVTSAACASILAIGFILQQSKNAAPAIVTLHVVLTAITIVVSWLLVHTIFGVHYAHEYYQSEPAQNNGDTDAPSLDFPDDVEPDYWDFLYFSFVIGMTSQVSDVQITTRSMRRLALIHGVLSFFFNTTILAMSINLIAGLVA
jgi:uncharacterized membrane protein